MNTQSNIHTTFIHSYTFYYDDDDDITYLTIAENMKEESAFSFLAEVKKKFLKKYDMKIIKGSFAYQLRDYNDDLKTIVKFCEDNPDHTRTASLISSLNDTTEILRESVEKLLDRNEKLNIIAQKSKNLKNTSEDISKMVNILNFII